MENIGKLDDQLYASIYVLPKIGDYNKIWGKVNFCKQKVLTRRSNNI